MTLMRTVTSRDFDVELKLEDAVDFDGEPRGTGPFGQMALTIRDADSRLMNDNTVTILLNYDHVRHLAQELQEWMDE